MVIFMLDAADSLIEAIQSSGYKAALVVSGGGSGALHALLSHPGASRFVLEVQIPYSLCAMFDYLGEQPRQACSEESAVKMAERAYERAYLFSIFNGKVGSLQDFPILGIACTAALRTNRPRKGADRAYICIKQKRGKQTCAVNFTGGTRIAQEEVLDAVLLNMIAENTGVDQRLNVPEEICRMQ